MARTRLRQLEQIRNSQAYDDSLNMGAAAELQSGELIGAADRSVVDSDSIAKTVTLSGNFVSLGANKDDQLIVEISDVATTYTIVSATYDGENNETTFVVAESLVGNVNSGVATVRVSTNKNLRRDLDFIRTQLKRIGQSSNWYDAPLAPKTSYHQFEIESSREAESDIILSNSRTFDAGAPYSLEVYLNGILLIPSSVSNNSVTTEYDYTERNSVNPVGAGEIGNRIRIHFPLTSTDVLQLRWTK